jgi:hypothetical protein
MKRSISDLGQHTSLTGGGLTAFTGSNAHHLLDVRPPEFVASAAAPDSF